jgi:hypothetical protein
MRVAYFVHVLTPAPGVRFGDNHFDLRDGDTATIDVTGLPEGFDPVALDVRGHIGAGVSSARRPL